MLYAVSFTALIDGDTEDEAIDIVANADAYMDGADLHFEGVRPVTLDEWNDMVGNDGSD